MHKRGQSGFCFGNENQMRTRREVGGKKIGGSLEYRPSLWASPGRLRLNWMHQARNLLPAETSSGRRPPNITPPSSTDDGWVNGTRDLGEPEKRGQ